MLSLPTSYDQVAILAIVIGFFALLAWGRFRYDLLAFATLIITVVLGLVPATEAFMGFGHPATITVALVLILSRALAESGAIDPLTRAISPLTGHTSTHVAGLAGSGALLSGFMNNVGALGLLMPVALQSALKAKRPGSLLLMPLSFGCILGGLVTLIGTPPNIIVASIRADVLGESFQMFDYTPVGGAVALVGLVFLAVVGWRLVPARQNGSAEQLFDLGDYVTEIQVVEGSKAVDGTITELAELTKDVDAEVVGLLRQGRRLPRLQRREVLQIGDLLLIEAAASEIEKFVKATGFKLAEDRGKAEELLRSGEGEILEAAVPPDCPVVGRSLGQLRLSARHNLVAIGLARQGKPYHGRLRDLRLQAGDILLLHGERDHLAEGLKALGLLPLAERGLSYGLRDGAWWIVGCFAAAIAIASTGVLPAAVTFGGAIAVLVFGGRLPLRQVYAAIDWPVIVLLGALIPVGSALQTTGATDTIVDGIQWMTQGWPAAAVLTLILVVTMTVSDVLNNAATAVIMAPISLILADRMAVNPDAFLMAVAVGASCAFLTPIGHQNNALILGPGGYRFGDYWRLGLPLEILVVGVAVPMILLVWPL
ncbi:SLC13 family permease [Limibacillus halophilus]|uniref:Di/tricarboxylate transporter n=1 Tax=Limibacillus halophilus TaxID=1579333 RepID=A0A839STC5_9PROT|nr:SLC13 family permease [Limibacillus halophilus]MBB3066107.1 di/tricarboxylate transporter [Limibacillus halophilus]